MREALVTGRVVWVLMTMAIDAYKVRCRLEGNTLHTEVELPIGMIPLYHQDGTLARIVHASELPPRITLTVAFPKEGT